MSADNKVKNLSDYCPPQYVIKHVSLDFQLEDEATQVTAISQVERNGEHNQPLALDGIELSLLSVKVDGTNTHYEIHHQQLIIEDLPQQFELEIVTVIAPVNNSSLEGLYKSAGVFSTQCEAEGFRKITYFLDRPDVLAKYDVKITADKSKYPYLLANGNKTASGELSDGKHWVSWQDPFNKPSYLFALVAGDFDLLTDRFVTRSGRDVALELYVDKGNLNRGHHALESLKKAMKWDEDTFDLEYDLDIYMIVAVDFFNMGAMENKGLNIFNSKFVLADPDSATDEDYFNIESVIAHEYFHNWTGNRVTCRDWFQLSLKEGLTVFRDQQFSSDMSSAVVNRINNVRVIREHQFAEDASPMSHPIRPQSVIEMNNFYTVTVYNKGAEVIRMMHTLLGKEKFKQGMDLYFKRHDGSAVTCDDFVQAMEDASGVDLAQFRRWYSQSGTPKLTVSQEYDNKIQQFTLNVEQHTEPTADQSQKLPLHIPLAIELLDGKGYALPVGDSTESGGIYDVKNKNTKFSFDHVCHKPIVSLLGGFSAPVKLECQYSDVELMHLMSHASDEFAQWDAAQQLFTKHLLAMCDKWIPGQVLAIPQVIVESAQRILGDKGIGLSLKAEMLTLPSFETLCQHRDQVNVEAIYHSLERAKQTLADDLYPQWLALYRAQPVLKYSYDQQGVAVRRVKNLCLMYMAKAKAVDLSLIQQQYSQADNMTDTLGVLKACQGSQNQLFDDLMENFEHKWKEDPLVLDKWFGLHAGADRSDILSRLDLLQSHQLYTINNPNRVRAVVGTFAFYNIMGFHAVDGSGYRMVTDYLIKLNSINPQVAARIITPLLQWRRYDEKRALQMQHQLLRIADVKDLSSDLFEKVSKSLEIS